MPHHWSLCNVKHWQNLYIKNISCDTQQILDLEKRKVECPLSPMGAGITGICNLCLFDSMICFIFIIYLILFLNLGLDPPTICFTCLVGYHHHHHNMKVPWERSEEQIISSFWKWFSELWSPIKVGIHNTSPKAHFSRLSTQVRNPEATNFPQFSGPKLQSHQFQALNQEGAKNVTSDVDDGWLYVILKAIQED